MTMSTLTMKTSTILNRMSKDFLHKGKKRDATFFSYWYYQLAILTLSTPNTIKYYPNTIPLLFTFKKFETLSIPLFYYPEL